MARRKRTVTNREDAVARGRFDTVENRTTRQNAQAVQAYDREGEGAEWAPDENLIEALDQLGSGRDASATGFARRLFGSEQARWDPEVPYPQVEPTATTNEDRPRTIAMGYDPGNQIVRVTFRPDKSGHSAVYEYYGVPEHVYQEFSATYSPGRMIDDLLNGYLYTRRYDLE